MTVKKDKVSTKKEKDVLLTSYQSINMLSRTLGIKESVIKAWLGKNRPTYFTEYEKHEHTDSRTISALEKKAALEQEAHDTVVRQEQEKADKEFQEELEKARQNADNQAMEKLMAHKERDSKGNRRFVTIMTPGASERGDEYRKVIKKNQVDELPHVHRPKQG